MTRSLLVPTVLLAAALGSGAANPRPNILFLFTDDHAAHAIGAYGGRLAGLNPTPTIDRLAREGMRFTNVFCNNSICTCSRASILTGQYSNTNGVRELDEVLPASRHDLPREIRKAGYQTALIGKWHLTVEPKGFDYYQVLPGQGEYFNPTFRVRGAKPWPQNTVQHEGHSSDVITDQSIAWLEGRDRSRPFLLMHQFKAPHDMFQFAPRYAEYLADVTISAPQSFERLPAFGSAGTRGENGSLERKLGTSVSRRHPVRNYGTDFKIDSDLPDREFKVAAYQEYLKRYLRCVKGVDDNIARLLAYLKKDDLLEDTVIIYTSDQGMMLGEHDLIDKRWIFDESMRMPLIVRYPAMVKPGSTCGLLVNNTDFAPTLLDMAGIETPASMQGRSFAKALRGEPLPDWRTATYYRYWMHLVHHDIPAHFGIRTHDYKLVFYYGRPVDPADLGKPSMSWKKNSFPIRNTPAAWELYDLRKDPFETRNVYRDPGYKETITNLKKRLRALREELDETDRDLPHIQAVIDAHWDQ